jgi:hypothetical protein
MTLPAVSVGAVAIPETSVVTVADPPEAKLAAAEESVNDTGALGTALP